MSLEVVHGQTLPVKRMGYRALWCGAISPEVYK
jgi:hypothetical protein